MWRGRRARSEPLSTRSSTRRGGLRPPGQGPTIAGLAVDDGRGGSEPVPNPLALLPPSGPGGSPDPCSSTGSLDWTGPDDHEYRSRRARDEGPSPPGVTPLLSGSVGPSPPV